ncbi:hypothetical protein EV426DRAFT_588964 [Tirmania nivea]|nr:hypothetical protein EV426DRAFT_588964 [Tirmania nivea]
MTMDRVLHKSGPSVETTIVPALPLFRLPTEEKARQQEDSGANKEESRAVRRDNGVRVANLPTANGVASKANGSISKQHISVPPAGLKESVWRKEKIKPVDFGNAGEKKRGRLWVQDGSGGVGRGAVRFGDLTLNEDVGQHGKSVNGLVSHNPTIPGITREQVANPTTDTGRAYTKGWCDQTAGREHIDISNDTLRSWGLPSSNCSTTHPLNLQQPQPLAEGDPEIQHQHQPPSITTPPPTAMLHIFHSQLTSPYSVANHGGIGHQYSGPLSPFFPHGREGFGVMPPPPHPLQQTHSPHPYHQPTGLMSSSIDGEGFQYPPSHQQMLPLHSHFSQHPQPHFQRHPYPPPQYLPNGYPNPVDSRPPTTDGPNFHAHNPHPMQYPQPPYPEFYPASNSNPSGSSGHVSPFPPPTLPYPSSIQGRFIPHTHASNGSPLSQQLDENDHYNHSQHIQKQCPLSPDLEHVLQSVNEKKVTNHILDQFGRSTFADLTLRLTFSSSFGGERISYRLKMPFHSLVGARMGVTVRILGKRGWAGPREIDRHIQVSLDDIFQDEEGVMDSNVKWTIGNLMKYLTETAVRIALAWVYGCSERWVEEWFYCHTAQELQDMISRVQSEEQMEPSSDGKFTEQGFSMSSAAEEVPRGHRSAAPSPEPAGINSHPPSRNLPEDVQDDTEGEDLKDDLELERQLSNPETQATTPHQEAPSRKQFTYFNTPGVWSPGLMPSRDSSLNRILSVLAAATLLDIPELVRFCERKLAAHIQSVHDLSSGLESLHFLLTQGKHISLPNVPSFAAIGRFSYVHALLYEIFSATMTDVVGRCLNRLARGCTVEELDRQVLRGLPFEIVVGTALGIVNRMKVLESVKERIDVIRKLVIGEMRTKGIVVAAGFGVTPTVSRITKSFKVRFGEVEGVPTAAIVVVGRRVRRKFVWVEA